MITLMLDFSMLSCLLRELSFGLSIVKAPKQPLELVEKKTEGDGARKRYGSLSLGLV